MPRTATIDGVDQAPSPRRNRHLERARRQKFDEFYTRWDDVEEELMHYRDQFRGKKVYCNCDDESSAFFKFLRHNYKRWGLTGLTATAYTGRRGGGAGIITYNSSGLRRRELGRRR